MKSLVLTLVPGGTTIHPAYHVFSTAPYVDRAHAVQWNVVHEGVTTMLIRVWGDRERVDEELADIPEVRQYDLTPTVDGAFYAYFQQDNTRVDGSLFDAFSRDGVVVAPPIDYFDDGTARFEVVGESADLQAAIESVPPAVDLRVEEVGEYDAARRSPAAALTERQREAVRAALEVGYYELPRRASNEDVAAALDCAPSTASEHLRKAETKVFRALFG